MRTAVPTTYLAIALLGGVLLGLPLQASQQAREKARAKLNERTGEMSTCAGYFLLLAFMVENSAGPDAKTELAHGIRSMGQAMFVQAMRVANSIGMEDRVATERLR